MNFGFSQLYYPVTRAISAFVGSTNWTTNFDQIPFWVRFVSPNKFKQIAGQMLNKCQKNKLGTKDKQMLIGDLAYKLYPKKRVI